MFRKVLNTDKHSDNNYYLFTLPLSSSYNLSTLFLVPHMHSTGASPLHSISQTRTLIFQASILLHIYDLAIFYLWWNCTQQQNILKFAIVKREVHTERTLRSNYAIKNFLIYLAEQSLANTFYKGLILLRTMVQRPKIKGQYYVHWHLGKTGRALNGLTASSPPYSGPTDKVPSQTTLFITGNRHTSCLCLISSLQNY